MDKRLAFELDLAAVLPKLIVLAALMQNSPGEEEPQIDHNSALPAVR